MGQPEIVGGTGDSTTASKPLKNPGDPYGTRTRVYAVKGRRPRPLDEGVTGQEVYWSNAGGSRYESKNCRPIGNFFPDTGHIYQVDRSPQRYLSYLIDIK